MKSLPITMDDVRLLKKNGCLMMIHPHDITQPKYLLQLTDSEIAVLSKNEEVSLVIDGIHYKLNLIKGV